ncbi:MAG: hypothetical protein ACOCXZ_02030, partial [Chloroflexota bacterium]
VQVFSVLNPATIDRFQRRTLPVDAAAYIAANQPPGPMFNSYNYGGYLMWALPEYPVYVDGRTDLYRSDFLVRWLETIQGLGGWQGVLDADGINLVVIEEGSGLDVNLSETPGWTRVYPQEPAEAETEPAADDDGLPVVIYTRDDLLPQDGEDTDD